MTGKGIPELVKALEFFMAIIATGRYEEVPVAELRSEEAVTNIVVGISAEICEIAGISLDEPDKCTSFIQEVRRIFS